MSVRTKIDGAAAGGNVVTEVGTEIEIGDDRIEVDVGEHQVTAPHDATDVGVAIAIGGDATQVDVGEDEVIAREGAAPGRDSRDNSATAGENDNAPDNGESFMLAGGL